MNQTQIKISHVRRSDLIFVTFHRWSYRSGTPWQSSIHGAAWGGCSWRRCRPWTGADQWGGDSDNCHGWPLPRVYFQRLPVQREQHSGYVSVCMCTTSINNENSPYLSFSAAHMCNEWMQYYFNYLTSLRNIFRNSVCIFCGNLFPPQKKKN